MKMFLRTYCDDRNYLVYRRADPTKSKFSKVIAGFDSKSISVSLLCKALILPFYLMKIAVTDAISIPEARNLLRYGNFPTEDIASSIYVKSDLFKLSLQRLLILDLERISRSGNSFHIVRQKLNVARKTGYTNSIVTGESAKEMLNVFVKSRGWKQPCTDVFNFPAIASDIEVIAACVWSADNTLISMSAAIYTQRYAKNFLCLSLIRGESRWVAMETLIDELFRRGVTFLHSDGLVGLDSGNFYFQEKLKYRTYSIKI